MKKTIKLTNRILAMVVSLAMLFTMIPYTGVESAYGATSTSKESVIYNYIRNEMGLNMAAACGMLANINEESGFRPNNMENVAEAKLKYTDESYTEAVNNGTIDREKFATQTIKNSDGSTRGFGYGLCQWTSAGRKRALYDYAQNYAKEKGIKFDISNTKMQMGFLKEELSQSYKTTWYTLKKVPDSEVGAFLSAYVMCTNFEVPADTGVRSYARAKYALTGFWDEYSGKLSNEEGNGYLGICGYTYPTTLVKGKGMSCIGYIVANKKIKNVTAKIVDQEGNVKYSFTDTRTTSNAPYYYNLLYTANKSGYAVDDKMAFSKLDNGSYKYILSATDFNNKTVQFERNFKVSDTATANKVYYGTECLDLSSLGISDYSYPKVIKKGNSYKNKGIVSSNYNLNQVSVKVLDLEGNIKASAVVLPKAENQVQSFDLSQLDEKLDLSQLDGGEYIYRVYAKDYMKGAYLLKETFYVNSKAIADTVVPQTIPSGKDFTIKGIITSDVPISMVHVRVINSEGSVVTTKKVYPNAPSYDLKDINQYIDFAKCVKGNYQLLISAKDVSGNHRLLTSDFSVYTASKLRITDYNYPSKIKKGSGYSIKGMVRSNYYLKTVKVKIENSKGVVVLEAAADLKGLKKLTYSVKNLDSKITFGKLAKGKYRYKVSSTDSKVTRTLVNKEFTVY